MADAVLTINAGSSSIKFALFDAATLDRIASGAVTKIGVAPQLTVQDATGKCVAERSWDAGATLSHEVLLQPMLDWVQTHLGAATLLAAGHRIVHGGRDFTGPALLDPAALNALEALVPLAPLHQPHALAAVHAVMALRPACRRSAASTPPSTMACLMSRPAWRCHGISTMRACAATASMAFPTSSSPGVCARLPL